MAEQVEQAEHGGHSDHRAGDGQHHGDDGPEGEEKDQHGGEEPEPFACSEGRHFHLLDRRAQELSLDAGPVRPLGQVDHRLDICVGDAVDVPVELHLAVGDVAIRADLAGPRG